MNAVIQLFGMIVAVLFVATPAHAYLDPVTGSLLIQGLVALIAGIVASVKSVRQKIISIFKSIFKRKDA